MPKFFVEPDKVKDGRVVIDTDDVKHITRVLRMEKGDIITVCDTTGTDYEAEISEICEKAIMCDIISSCVSDTEPEVKVTLFQALPKSSKMEYIIQKTTELGICEIVPVKMARCVVKIEGSSDEKKKVSRWEKISEAAAKQSGRGIIPKISTPVSFNEAISRMKEFDLSFAPYECEEEVKIRTIVEKNDNVKNVAFIIGPEGGFDPAEIDKLKSEGIQTVTLGKRILRTETAGEAVLAMLMYGLNEI